MKKLINRPDAVVDEMLDGLVAIYPALRRLPSRPVILRADADRSGDSRVALISGGGSGHEPAHAGYVGQGMLGAAVAGDVFTSPSPDAVLSAIKAVGGKAGVLLIVKNYTGDRLNFGLAAELARAEGIPVEMVVVADDVALPPSAQSAGPRGLAGTILVHKIAGAAAEAGLPLDVVAAEAKDAAEAVGTMGVALTPCTIPAAGTPSFSLAEDEIELGLGIHGEPGARRIPVEPVDATVDRLLAAIVGGARHVRGDRVVLLINNLGGTTTMELAILARRAVAVLQSRGLILERVYAGTFLSSLEMAGVSLSVMEVDDLRLARLDAPTAAPAWPNAAAAPRPTIPGFEPLPPETDASAPLPPPKTELGRSLDQAIRAVGRTLIDSAGKLNELDRAVGDGDLGLSLARGVQAVLETLPTLPLDDPAATLQSLSTVLQRSLGGTSGPLYAMLLFRASGKLREGDPASPKTWAEAFSAGVHGVAELGDARAQDRTMLDALFPACETLSAHLARGEDPHLSLDAAAEAAEAGARATASMPPRRGRSSYLADRALGHPDPGAQAVALWLRTLANTLRDRAQLTPNEPNDDDTAL